MSDHDPNTTEVDQARAADLDARWFAAVCVGPDGEESYWLLSPDVEPPERLRVPDVRTARAARPGAEHEGDDDRGDERMSDERKRAVETAMMDTTANPFCLTCTERRRLVTMADVWAWESSHEPECPQHEDNHDAVEQHLIDLEAVIGDAAEIERIWRASTDDDWRGVE